MMRIGIDCRKAGDYGIGTYIRGLLGGLAELDPGDEYVLFAARHLFDLFPSAPNFSHVAVSSPHYSIRELFELRNAAAPRRLDVFHAPHYVVPFLSVPLVVTIHDLIHLKLPTWRRHPLAPAYARWMIGRAVRKSARILTGSESVRRDLESRYPRAAPRITVTPFAVDSRFSQSEADPTEILGRLGLRRDCYLLFAGNDKPHKNLDRLVAAYRRFRTKHPQVNLALVGGSTRFQGEQGVVSAGFVPFEELAALYRGAIALVQPSIEEGFGMPVLEAMSSGTAVAISNQPALTELAGEAAILFDPLSVESMTAALTRVTEEKELRRNLAAKGSQRARLFSWRRCAEMTREAHRDAAMKSNR